LHVIVLHGFWHHELELCLWGERSGQPGRTARRTRTGRPPDHPFAPSADELVRALRASGVCRPDTLAGDARLVLDLPSEARAPAASPFLLRDDDAASARRVAPARLAEWTVPVLSLSGCDAADTLMSLWQDAARHASSATVVVADDLRFWAELAKLTLAQVAAGGVVPVLERARTGTFARWHAAGGGAATARLPQFARALPAACRAAEPDTPPDLLVRGAFDALTDAYARRALERGGADAALADAVERARGWTARSPVASAWVDGLATRTGEVRDGAASERARAALDVWSRPVRDIARQAFHACFRLQPPPDEDEGMDGQRSGVHADAPGARDEWRLEFLLQATDEPTLLVPAADVWRTRGRVLRAVGRTLEDPQERLLEDLGRACRIFPPIADALRERAPTGLALDTAGAHAFLREAAGPLEQGGFGVLVPSWWNAPAAKLALELRAWPEESGMPGMGGIEAVCAYDWRVAVGDETLSAEEFRKLARLKAPLVRVRGSWVELRADDVANALALLERQEAGAALTAADVLRASAGTMPAAGGLPIVRVVADGWLGELLAGAAEARVQALPTPEGFTGELRPYQERGLGWLAFLDRFGLGACLADDMGLGKTIQLLALLVAERAPAPAGADAVADVERARSEGPTLLVCPMSVVGNWQREAARFAPMLRVHVHHGGERLTGEAFAAEADACDLVLTTYALAARDRDVLAAVAWRRIVLDEAQNIKNSATRQAQALRSLAAERRVALTGTPVENRLTELWSILDFLNPGLLGSKKSFRERYATPIERYGDDERAAALRRMTAPFILRRVKTDRSIIQDLPEKIDIREYCNLTREQATLYQAVVDDMMRKIEESAGMQRRAHVLTAMLRLKQVCNHPAHLMADGSVLAGRSGKLERLEEVLTEAVDAGERALVFTQYAEWGHLLRPHLQTHLGREVAFLYGGTSRADRDALVARFQAGQGAAVLLLSLKAGGTGLNLTAANHVVHFDRWWNPAVEEQASDRAFRIGQTRNVQVRKFICVGTLEERIDAMIERKKALAERIVGAGESWLTELSTDELRRVIALSADAVSE
jgi:superfamily II DNA or RNA helicase